MRSPLRSPAQVEGPQGDLPQPEKDLERPSSTRLEARFPYYDLRVKTRSPSPFAWRPDFLAAPSVAAHGLFRCVRRDLVAVCGMSLALQGRSLTTGLPGKSLRVSLLQVSLETAAPTSDCQGHDKSSETGKQCYLFPYRVSRFGGQNSGGS